MKCVGTGTTATAGSSLVLLLLGEERGFLGIVRKGFRDSVIFHWSSMERRKSFVSFIVRAGAGAWAGAVFRDWGVSGVRGGGIE